MSSAYDKRRAEQSRLAWLAKGKKPCAAQCGAEIERNRNDTNLFCSPCLAERRHASDKIRQKQRRATNGHKEKYRAYSLKRNYGITIDQFNALFERQGRCCAICKSTEPGWRRGWHVDHNHKTGEIRGILCHNCNFCIGQAKDNPDILLRAAMYLESSAALPFL